MGIKWVAAVVLLAALTCTFLAPASEKVPSWPLFHLSLLVEQWLPWLYQALTPPPVWLMRTMTGFAASKALYIACELQVADMLSTGPLSSKEIAQKAGTDPDRTERLMKFLSVQGIFQRDQKGIYANTVASEYLRKDHPNSQYAHFLLLGHEITLMFQKYLEALYDPSLLPISAAFNTTSMWEMYEDPANAKARTNFNRAMVEVSMASLPFILRDFPWSRYDNATLVDVGGGRGHVTAQLLRANEGFKGVVFDLEKGIDGAKLYLSEVYPDVYPRITLVSGSFFDSVPVGGDIYILKHILHDWNDTDTVKILQTIQRALQSSAKPSSLLIIEHLYDYPPLHARVAFMDLVMLGISGKERSLEEFTGLFKQAGLKLVSVHPTRGLVAVIEAQLA